jgi:hypothetical protein
LHGEHAGVFAVQRRSCRRVLSEGGARVGAMPTDTASWADVEAAAPELARVVRASFDVRKHCTLATLRADGGPRISGTEVEWSAGELWIGSMPGARKALDLRRDPRLALHSPTVDPPERDESSWPGEAKVAGVAVEVPSDDPEDGAHRFRIGLHEVVHTRVDGDALLITSWHVGGGVQQVRRS